MSGLEQGALGARTPGFSPPLWTHPFLPSPQLTLFSNCRPGDRTFRASSSNFFFLLVLLLGLAISWVPALYSIFA